MGSPEATSISDRYRKRRSLSVPVVIATVSASSPTSSLAQVRTANHTEPICDEDSVHKCTEENEEGVAPHAEASSTFTAKKNEHANPLPAAVNLLRSDPSNASDSGTNKSRSKRSASGIFSRVMNTFNKSQSNLGKPHIKELFGNQNTVGISSNECAKGEVRHRQQDIDEVIAESEQVVTKPRAATALPYSASQQPALNGHTKTLSASEISSLFGSMTSPISTSSVVASTSSTSAVTEMDREAVASSADHFVDADKTIDTVKRAEATVRSIEDDNKPAPVPHVASIFARSRSSDSTEQTSHAQHRRSTSYTRRSISNDSSSNAPAPIPMVPEQGQDGKPVRRIRSLWRLFHRFTEPVPDMPALDDHANTIGAGVGTAGVGHSRSLSASSPHKAAASDLTSATVGGKGISLEYTISDTTFSSYVGALSHLNDDQSNVTMTAAHDGTLKASALSSLTGDTRDVSTLKARKSDSATTSSLPSPPTTSEIFQDNSNDNNNNTVTATLLDRIPLPSAAVEMSRIHTGDDLPSEEVRALTDNAIPSTIASVRSQSMPVDLPTVILPDGQVHQADKSGPHHKLAIRSKVPLVADTIEDSEFSEDDDEAMEIESRIAATFMVRERCRARAKQLFEEDETSGIARNTLCEYLGKRDDTRALILTAYMEMFDFRKLRLDIAMRRLCSHLFLIGEAQVIDRVIHAFSKRYWACNPHSLLGSEDAVYGVAYSLLLLNTDLHNPQNTRRMTRSAFMKNTMAAINMANQVSDVDTNKMSSEENNLATSRTSSDRRSVHSTVSSSDKQQKKELVVLLKEMYASIRSQPLQMPQDLVQKAESDKQSNRASTMASKGATGTRHHKGSSSLAVQSQHQSMRQPSRLSFGAVSHSSADASSIGGSDVEPGVASGVGSSPNLRNIMAAYSAQVNLDDPSTTQIKSGVLARKHLFERTDKKATNRSWRECLVVVERGEMKMFKKEKDVINGDGSELTNVQLQLGQLTLRHSLTVQLPPPGYSKRRAYVFAVQLPNGGVYLFQAASPDLVCEWVAVCNYWAARESKEPLGGGVGNVDYGWGINSMRRDQQAAETTDYNISEWHAPQPPMMRSLLDEAGQLNALLKQIQHLEDELITHKELHSALARFPPKSSTHTRAFSNWERRSQYLLRELIKYQTYADCLQQAVLARHSTPTTETTTESNKHDGNDETDHSENQSSQVTITTVAATTITATTSNAQSSSGSSSATKTTHLDVSPVLFKTKHRSTPSNVTASTMDSEEEEDDEDDEVDEVEDGEDNSENSKVQS